MYRIIKRALDVLMSLALLILLSPLLVLVACLIKTDSPGSILFRQNRVGRDGKIFRILKFRTMYAHAPSSVATRMLLNADRCITRVGRTLRKSSIDELPQLINVLRGEMSLIGPRPLVPEEAEIHEQRAKLGAYRVRPGITGWAQVNGRDCVNAKTKAELDAYYAQRVSLGLDLKIVLFSLLCVITARGIQEGGESLEDRLEDASAENEGDSQPRQRA
ncbi:MAG: sugar transferase [Oscillospiraceae bacterium]|nr:sugar transferase [Oscillospiraceae bacterium]